MCLTGGDDGTVRLWDLRRVDADGADGWEDEGDMVNLSEIQEENEDGDGGDGDRTLNGEERNGKSAARERDDPCVRLLEGHSKAVTSLYFEDDCLVRWIWIMLWSWTNCSAFRSQVLQIRLCDNGI